MRASISINPVDRLEPRLLLAFASLNSAGVLSIVGDANNNDIKVTYSGASVKASRDGSNLYFDKTKVKKIWADGYAGDDTITIGVPLPSTLIGEAGFDWMTGNVKDDV